MLIIDAHCDTALSVLEKGADFYDNDCQLDIKRLLGDGFGDKDKTHGDGDKSHENGNGRVQFFAAFADPVKYRGSALTRVHSIIDCVYRAQELYNDKITVCASARDIDKAAVEDKVAAILTVEGGEALNGELSILRQLYRIGVRSLTLAWNHRNLLADGSGERFGAGLSEFGRQVVAEMNRLGMIVDVSHLCEASFYDVLELTKAPVIASHSNSRVVCDHVRNLNDTQLEMIKANGGVIGINFYPYFLNNTGEASIDDVVKHIEHICSVTGENHIGIGSDFDGIECTPRGLEGPQCVYSLFDRLSRMNYSNVFIEKFAGLNFMRVISEVFK